MGIRWWFCCSLILLVCSIASGDLLVDDNGYIGSDSEPDAIQIKANGDIVMIGDLSLPQITITGTEDWIVKEASITGFLGWIAPTVTSRFSIYPAASGNQTIFQMYYEGTAALETVRSRMTMISGNGEFSIRTNTVGGVEQSIVFFPNGELALTLDTSGDGFFDKDLDVGKNLVVGVNSTVIGDLFVRGLTNLGNTDVDRVQINVEYYLPQVVGTTDFLVFQTGTDTKWGYTTPTPASGDWGFWTRTGTAITTKTADDDFTVGSTAFDVDSTNKTVGIGAPANTTNLITASRTASVSTNQNVLTFAGAYTPTTPGLEFTAITGVVSLTGSEDVACLDGINLSFSSVMVSTTITSVTGLKIDMELAGSPKGASFVTSADLITLLDPNISSMTIDEVRGINLEEMTAGTVNWQIYSAGGDSFHGGDIAFGQTDKAERIGSDADGTLDLHAGTSIELHQATNIGDGTNEMKVSATGDTYWAGTAGLIFGSFFGNDINFVVAGGTGTYSIITDADIAVGQTNNTTFQNNQELDIGTFAGMYNIKYSCTVKGTGAGKHLVAAIGVDVGGVTGDVAQGPGRSHSITLGNSEMTLCSTAILDLSADDEVSIMITNETDNSNVTIEHVNLVLTQIGGT